MFPVRHAKHDLPDAGKSTEVPAGNATGELQIANHYRGFRPVRERNNWMLT
jgi:hypothetical protein